MARVPYVDREKMDAEGQEIYDRIRRDRSSDRVGFQFRALLHRPKAVPVVQFLPDASLTVEPYSRPNRRGEHERE